MRGFQVLLAPFWLAGWSMVAAQQPEGLDAIYSSAMAAFAASKWVEAAQGLEKVVAAATDPADQARLAPVVYTMGAAHFNAGAYPKAIEAFKVYLSRYPQGEKANEVRLAAAKALFLAKDIDGAAKLFAQFDAIPAFRDEALLAQAECFRMTGRAAEQMQVLEKLIKPQIVSRLQAQGALQLAEAYLAANETVKALAVVEVLRERQELVDNMVSLNSLKVGIGDKLAAAKSYPEALAAYRGVSKRADVIVFQKERIARMTQEGRLASATPGKGLDLQSQLEQAKSLLAEFEKLPDYWPSVLFRMASAYYDAGQKWEALVVFDRLLADYPSGADAEPALFASVVCSSELFRVGRTLRLCQEYLRRFPKGPNAATVSYLMGVTALQGNDPEAAIGYLREILENQSDSKFREEIRFLLGNAYFLKGDFAKARESYDSYIRDYESGVYREESSYRRALSLIYEGSYEAAFTAFRDYTKSYPGGAFAADAGYRTMLCKYAARRYQEIVAEVALWEKQFANDPIRGDVLSLLGDAWAGLEKPADAAAAYTKAYRAAGSDDVLNYALMEAGSQLRKQGRWEDVVRLFEGFVKERPGHPTVVTGIYWIGKAKARLGKVDEAKAFLVATLAEHIEDPSREAVEQLLQQLAQLCARPSQAGENFDALAELRKQLEPVKAQSKVGGTAQARLLYAEIELLPLIKRPGDVAKIWSDLEVRFLPKDLSAPLLAGTGDYRMASGDLEGARKLYELLRDRYPKSAYRDAAEVGLGEIALAGGDARQALQCFGYAADEIAGARLKDAMIGKARAQFALGKFVEAKQGFQEIAANRDWRGDATAQAVYYLGEIEAKQGHWAEAIAFYQRVFVAYQRYLPWAAKSYLRAAEAFEQLGKRPEAIGHLREMLRNEKLKDFAETERARELLEGWGAS